MAAIDRNENINIYVLECIDLQYLSSDWLWYVEFSYDIVALLCPVMVILTFRSRDSGHIVVAIAFSLTSRILSDVTGVHISLLCN